MDTVCLCWGSVTTSSPDFHAELYLLKTQNEMFAWAQN
jgi:hypothetical protein